MKKVFQVDVYDVSVAVIVTRDIPAAYLSEFGVVIDDTRMACLGYNGRRFALFLEPVAKARHEIIAHEIFHLTHRILEKCTMNFDPGHHEMGAYLCEHLTKKIFAILKTKPFRDAKL